MSENKRGGEKRSGAFRRGGKCVFRARERAGGQAKRRFPASGRSLTWEGRRTQGPEKRKAGLPAPDRLLPEGSPAEEDRFREKEDFSAEEGEKRRPGGNGQLRLATFLAAAGMALLFMGFWCAPEGEIHHSVLIGFGEVSTFAGALFGVDYSYKYRYGRKEE